MRMVSAAVANSLKETNKGSAHSKRETRNWKKERSLQAFIHTYRGIATRVRLNAALVWVVMGRDARILVFIREMEEKKRDDWPMLLLLAHCNCSIPR